MTSPFSYRVFMYWNQREREITSWLRSDSSLASNIVQTEVLSSLLSDQSNLLYSYSESYGPMS